MNLIGKKHTIRKKLPNQSYPNSWSNSNIRSLSARQRFNQCCRCRGSHEEKCSSDVNWKCFRCNQQGHVAGAKMCLVNVYHTQEEKVEPDAVLESSKNYEEEEISYFTPEETVWDRHYPGGDRIKSGRNKHEVRNRHESIE